MRVIIKNTRLIYKILVRVTELMNATCSREGLVIFLAFDALLRVRYIDGSVKATAALLLLHMIS